MTPEFWLAIAALSVALIGHAINFCMLVMHCRRDRRNFKRMDEEK